jgi:hypothetical protein
LYGVRIDADAGIGMGNEESGYIQINKTKLYAMKNIWGKKWGGKNNTIGRWQVKLEKCGADHADGMRA